MAEQTMGMEKSWAAQRGLLRRLRQGLGLSGLAVATLGSGPCGSCPEPMLECASFEQLEGWRSEYLAEADAWCRMGAAGQAGEAGQGCTYPGYRSVENWNRAQGCPDLEVMEELSQEHGFPGNARKAVSQPGSECCYQFQQTCGGGRPFLVRGEARVAALLGGGSDDCDEFSQALADDWTRDALAEHASVAAFARLTLYLMAAGAPAKLVERSQRASLDELRHAGFCFAQASRHATKQLTPGALDLSQAVEAMSFEELMFMNLIEGCIGESLAAVRVSEQARLAADPELTRGLRRISDDEADHALLAFEILSWGLLVQPVPTRRAVEQALRAGRPRAPTAPSGWTPSHAQRWNRAGRLSLADKAELDSSTWRLTVQPLLFELSRSASTRAGSREQLRSPNA